MKLEVKLKSKGAKAELARKTRIVEMISACRLDQLIKSRISRSMVLNVDAEDVRQDVYLSIFRGPDPQKIFCLQRDGGLRPWLITTVRNTVLQVVRKRMVQKRGGALRHHGHGAADSSLVGRICDGRRSPLSRVAAAEVKSAIWAAVAKLEPKYRRAVKLLLHGHSHEEIAKQMYRSIASVRGYIRRGLAAMRGKLGSEANWFPDGKSKRIRRRSVADHQETKHKGET